MPREGFNVPSTWLQKNCEKRRTWMFISSKQAPLILPSNQEKSRLRGIIYYKVSCLFTNLKINKHALLNAKTSEVCVSLCQNLLTAVFKAEPTHVLLLFKLRDNTDIWHKNTQWLLSGTMLWYVNIYSIFFLKNCNGPWKWQWASARLGHSVPERRRNVG